jgi:hypothetical protein
MATRMEKYYKNDSNVSRTDKNKTLYNSIYSYGKYSNIEGIASIDNTNEVDIGKIKEMLNNREKYQIERKYRKINDEDSVNEVPTVKKRYNEDNDRSYDIMDVLSKAREEQKPDDKERVLSKTNYDILKNIKLKENVDRKDYSDDDEEDLKDLIQTITNTSLLNKLGDADLAADMLSDLKDDDTKVGELKDIKDLINESKEKPKEQTMDTSFFTSSLKLKKEDFVNNSNKTNSTFKTIVITILILAIIIVVGILVLRKLHIF